jgi:hypothetical protein
MMVTYNRLTFDNIEVIQKKAKTKENGCYTMRGILYRVRDGKVTHYGCEGSIQECLGHFTTTVGVYDTREQGMKLLKGI